MEPIEAEDIKKKLTAAVTPIAHANADKAWYLARSLMVVISEVMVCTILSVPPAPIP